MRQKDLDSHLKMVEETVIPLSSHEKERLRERIMQAIRQTASPLSQYSGGSSQPEQGRKSRATHPRQL